MLPRFSVFRPFYILAAVIVVLIVGGYSLTFMKTDLYPKMELPYMAVITAYPGASPEKVESEVTEVIQGKLSTVSGVEGVITTSAENVSMCFVGFVEDTDMDSALVKVSAAVNTIANTLPEGASTPTYLEINMDAMPTTFLGVSLDGKSQVETSKYVEDKILPLLERQPGVATVTATGIVSDTVEVSLNQSKIDDVNNKVLASVNDKLYDSKKKIDKGKSQLKKAKAELEKQEKKLQQAQKDTADQLGETTSGLTTGISATTAQISALTAAIQAATAAGQDTTKLKEELAKAQTTLGQLQSGLAQANSGSIQAASQFGSAAAQLAAAKSTIASSEAELKNAEKQYKSARKQALKSANIDALLDVNTLSQLISAQNFSMPAGSITDSAEKDFLLKVGESYHTVKELKGLVLTKIDGVGSITMSDVADINVLSSAGSTYSKLNGEDGIIISVTKSSVAATSDVSKTVVAAMDKAQKKNEQLNVMYLSDQGKYIDLYIMTILQGLLLGALLACVVLALFLRNVRPVLVIAFSIPFSVFLALVIMYFWGLSINLMTLSALSLAIGMLVDNSVVVLENIYRLQARGFTAERAAAQGAKQVTGAVVASTLTTICVFFPFVFTDGLVRQLMVPFALTISFALLASLLVALTAIPALGSKLFGKKPPTEIIWFERLKQAYGRSIAWHLNHKAPVLVTVTLLGFLALFLVIQTGVTLIPKMESNQISVTATMPEGMSEDEAEEVADELTKRLVAIDGIADVGTADSAALGSVMSTGSGLGGMSSSRDDEYSGGFMFYATVDKSKVHTEDQMAAIRDEVAKVGDGLDCEWHADRSAAMSSMLQEQLQIRVRGDDPTVLLDISQDVMDVIESIEGYVDVSNGQEDADETVQLVFDKNKVAELGTTVAQIYQQVAMKLNSSKDIMTLTNSKGEIMDVKLKNELNTITVENLLDTKFTVTPRDGSAAKTYKLSKVASAEKRDGLVAITGRNGTPSITVSAKPDEGYNLQLLSRKLEPKLDKLELPSGYEVEIVGTDADVNSMLDQMTKLMLLGAVLIYLIMMAQFASFLAPFIIILTVPLAFTGGVFALLLGGQELNVMSLMGFVILMGTIVNNGIVFVDFANQLRRGGMEKRSALIATGMTRMRPIMMTALTTIFAMMGMIFNPEIGASAERGMALVVAGGLLYGTFMTLYVVPIVYDLIWRKPMKIVDLGDDIDDRADDAEEFIKQMGDGAKGGLFELNEHKKERRFLRKQKKQEQLASRQTTGFEMAQGAHAKRPEGEPQE